MLPRRSVITHLVVLLVVAYAASCTEGWAAHGGAGLVQQAPSDLAWHGHALTSRSLASVLVAMPLHESYASACVQLICAGLRAHSSGVPPFCSCRALLVLLCVCQV